MNLRSGISGSQECVGSVSAESEASDLHPPLPQSWFRRSHTDLYDLQRPLQGPSDKLQTPLKETKQSMEQEEIQVIARDTVAVGNLGEKEPQKKAICPVPEEG